jgi:hypothetical protein
MDNRCAFIAKRRRTSTGPFSCFDGALCERFFTLQKTSIGMIYTLLEVALRIEYSGLDEATIQKELAACQGMGPRGGNVTVFNKAKALVRAMRHWEDSLGPVKVSDICF